jgi:hypothetical protein
VLRNAAQGKGALCLSKKQRIENGRKGGRTGFARRTGIHGLSKEQHRQYIRHWWAALTPEQRRKRLDTLQQGNRRWWQSHTPEEKSQRQRQAHIGFNHERRSAIMRRRWGDLTPQERSAIGRKANASLTPVQRSERARKVHAALTPEQRKERQRTLYDATCRRWVNLTPAERRTRLKSMRHAFQRWWDALTVEQKDAYTDKRLSSARQHPNGLETLVAQALAAEGIYAPDARTATPGQIYYTDTKSNYRCVRLTDGYRKRPDFKVKGQNKVVELYGDFYHSKEYCLSHGRTADYHWSAERLIDEYAKVDYQCLVFWWSEFQDPLRRAEIIQEIVVFATAAEPITSSDPDALRFSVEEQKDAA